MDVCVWGRHEQAPNKGTPTNNAKENGATFQTTSARSRTLPTVLLESHNYIASTSEWEIVTEARAATLRISDWASLGLSLLSVEWEGRGREQIRRIILNNVSSRLSRSKFVAMVLEDKLSGQVGPAGVGL